MLRSIVRLRSVERHHRIALIANIAFIAYIALTTATVHVETKDTKTKKTARGMTTKYPSFENAVAALSKLQQDAVLKGWQKAERSGGFKARPDAFSAMPAAPKGGAR